MRDGRGAGAVSAGSQRLGRRLAQDAVVLVPVPPANFDRVRARRLPAHGMDAGCIDRDVLAIAEETEEKSQRHGAAADVAGADEKNVFHNLERRGGERLREGKIKLGQVNAIGLTRAHR